MTIVYRLIFEPEKQHITVPYLSNLSILTRHPALKQELILQRRTIFGNKRYFFHIVMWMAALCYLVFNVFGDEFTSGFKVGTAAAAGAQPQTVSVGETPFIVVSLISSLAGALMVYFYLLFVVPFARFKKQRRYLWLGLVANCTVWIIGFTIAAMILGMTHASTKKFENNDISLVILISIVFSAFTAGFFFSLYYFLDLYDQQKNLNQYRDILTQKLEAETNFLKTQINPHFLFNTLNNIYSLTLSQSPDAAHITRQLRNLITYMLQDCTKDLVPLTGEIEFLKNYINLEKVRNKQENIDIQLHIKGEPGDKKIAPLLLINFIENAFKHGVKAGLDSAYVRISLLVMDNTLALEMVNSKPEPVASQNKAVTEAGGIGIQNVRRRLDILYPHKHKLRIVESPEDYSVYLSIEL